MDRPMTINEAEIAQEYAVKARGDVKRAFLEGQYKASMEAVDIIESLLDYADRHRVSHAPNSEGARPCDCEGDCYELWKIEQHDAQRWVLDATSDRGTDG